MLSVTRTEAAIQKTLTPSIRQTIGEIRVRSLSRQRTWNYFSKFPEITRLRDTTSSSVIGIPDAVISDNGPQEAGTEFIDFAESWEFRYTMPSPGHAQSNGQAERTGMATPTFHCWSITTPLERVGLTSSSLLTPEGTNCPGPQLYERKAGEIKPLLRQLNQDTV